MKNNNQKQDGRSKNGGRREGAGRRKGSKGRLAEAKKLMDLVFANDVLKEECDVVKKNEYGANAKRFKKTRFQMLIDAYLKVGLAFKRGHKTRDFSNLIKMGLETPDEELRKERDAYANSSVDEYLSKKKKIKPEEKVLEPWEIALNRQTEINKKLNEIISKQSEGNRIAIERYKRNQEKDGR